MSANQTETMTLRMPTDIKRAAAKQAALNTRSTAGQILYYIKQGLEADGALKNELGHVGLRNQKPAK